MAQEWKREYEETTKLFKSTSSYLFSIEQNSSGYILSEKYTDRKGKVEYSLVDLMWLVEEKDLKSVSGEKIILCFDVKHMPPVFMNSTNKTKCTAMDNKTYETYKNIYQKISKTDFMKKVQGFLLYGDDFYRPCIPFFQEEYLDFLKKGGKKIFITYPDFVSFREKSLKYPMELHHKIFSACLAKIISGRNLDVKIHIFNGDNILNRTGFGYIENCFTSAATHTFLHAFGIDRPHADRTVPFVLSQSLIRPENTENLHLDEIDIEKALSSAHC